MCSCVWERPSVSERDVTLYFTVCSAFGVFKLGIHHDFVTEIAESLKIVKKNCCGQCDYFINS